MNFGDAGGPGAPGSKGARSPLLKTDTPLAAAGWSSGAKEGLRPTWGSPGTNHISGKRDADLSVKPHERPSFPNNPPNGRRAL